MGKLRVKPEYFVKKVIDTADEEESLALFIAKKTADLNEQSNLVQEPPLVAVDD